MGREDRRVSFSSELNDEAAQDEDPVGIELK